MPKRCKNSKKKWQSDCTEVGFWGGSYESGSLNACGFQMGRAMCKKINVVMKWYVGKIYKNLMKWFLVWETLLGMFEDWLMVLGEVHGEN